jgi:hypothetical protein
MAKGLDTFARAVLYLVMNWAKRHNKHMAARDPLIAVAGDMMHRRRAATHKAGHVSNARHVPSFRRCWPLHCIILVCRGDIREGLPPRLHLHNAGASFIERFAWFGM